MESDHEGTDRVTQKRPTSWHPQLSPEARRSLQAVVYTFIDVVEDYRQRRYPSMRPEPGSQAECEIDELDDVLAGDWSGEPVRLAFGAAELHLRSAQDQLAGLGMLLGSNLEDSLMTLARGVTEAAARSVWLLDDRVDGRQRVARCMTERRGALHDQARLNARIGRKFDSGDRIRAIERSARQHGLPVGTARRGDLYVGAEEYPGATRAIELLFAHLTADFGIKAYADLSAVAHSTLAAFAARRPQITADEHGRVAPLRQGDRPEREMPIERGLVIAVSAFERAVRSYLTIFGWSAGVWDAFVRDAYARIRKLIGIPQGLIDIVRMRPGP